MASDNRAALLTIEDGLLRSMMNDPQLQSLLPCLKAAKDLMDSTIKGKKNCNKCEKDKNNIRGRALGQARVCVANARGDTLKALKNALNAKQLRILAKSGNGKTIKWTL